MSLPLPSKVKNVKLEELHLCKESHKVKYRLHLTIGTFVSLMLTMIGMWYHIEWLAHAAAVTNTTTSIIWIWE
jgi:hypothetical protein